MESNNKESLLYQEFIKVQVGIPELVISGSKLEKYITFPVTVRTNSLSFTAPHTRVCRRYKDFLWLYQRLKRIPLVDSRLSVPCLPRKQLPFWNFEDTFLESRRKSLENFLRRLVLEAVFLSSSALHLFLQTELSPTEMDAAIESGRSKIKISSNIKVVKVDQEFMDFMGISITAKSITSNNDSETSGSPDEYGRGSPVYWCCGKNTFKKVASLPHFTPVLKRYESFFANDDEKNLSD